jgi:hypothetical protein
LLGAVVGAIPTYVLMRQRKRAELAKLHADTDKVKAEAEKIRAEFNIIAADQPPKLKMLFVAANPGMKVQLDLAGEIRGIVQGVRSSKYEGALELDQLWGARWEDLRRQLLRNTPHILHFTGLSRDSGLIFEGHEGGADLIEAEQLRALLSLFHDRIRLVFVNTTASAQICEALARSIDFVIGIAGRIADDDAIRFAAAFYEAIADRKSVQTAFEFALANLPKGEEQEYKLFRERTGADPFLLPPGNGK